MKPTLSDISTLKPGMKIEGMEAIGKIIGTRDFKERVDEKSKIGILVKWEDNGDEEYYFQEELDRYGWKLLEEEKSYDWKKELNEITIEQFITALQDENCDSLEGCIVNCCEVKFQRISAKGSGRFPNVKM